MAERRSGFDEFVVSQGSRLLRSAYLLTGNRDAAEDLLQEVLERVYVAWPRVEDPLAYTGPPCGVARLIGGGTWRAGQRWR